MKPIVDVRIVKKVKRWARNLASFVVPKKAEHDKQISLLGKFKTVVIIPTYKPSYLTQNLVKNLYKWHENIEIVIVDDSDTEVFEKHENMFKKLKILARRSRIHYIKTPKNLHKAAALNYGFKYAKNVLNIKKIKVIITLDDDIIVTKKTIPTLSNKLYYSSNIGAVCSLAKVKNKNKNLVTRLQGLEYHGFNIIKIADNGFYKGPLVMQGMITAFKASAFCEVGGFSKNNLIEDYEITAKLKKYDWNVAIASDCWAWTTVPQDLSTLWRQRVRWTYWGIDVLGNYLRNLDSVLQDFIGHITFLSLTILIFLSFVVPTSNPIDKSLISALLLLTFTNFSISYMFSIFVLRFYREADWKDYLIRLSIIPEFLYSNFLTLVLLGAYPFFVYNKLFGKIETIKPIYEKGMSIFNKFGYSLSWSTRNLDGGEKHE